MSYETMFHQKYFFTYLRQRRILLDIFLDENKTNNKCAKKFQK